MVFVSGSEGMLSIVVSVRDFKFVIIEFEYSYFFGRLWDIDVLTFEGEIFFRRDYLLSFRRCLLCE